MPRASFSPSQRQYLKSLMPGPAEFQHPRLVPSPPSRPDWLHEVKFDGYRLQLHVAGGRPTIYTRNGHDWTDRFPELAEDPSVWPDVILDGELSALDERGQRSFARLRASISPGKTKLVAAIEFAEWTASGRLRQSSFKGLRPDKDAREVVREQRS